MAREGFAAGRTGLLPLIEAQRALLESRLGSDRGALRRAGRARRARGGQRCRALCSVAPRRWRAPPWSRASSRSRIARVRARRRRGRRLQEASDEEAVARPAVKVALVAEARIAPRTAVAGVLAPLPGRDVKVGALVAGRVDRVFVAEGDAVKVGQPLAHVEAEPLVQNVSQADGAARARRGRAAERAHQARARRAAVSRRHRRQAGGRRRARRGGRRRERAQVGAAPGRHRRRAARARAPCARRSPAWSRPSWCRRGSPSTATARRSSRSPTRGVLDLRAPVSAARIGDVAVGQRAELDVEGVGQVRRRGRGDRAARRPDDQHGDRARPRAQRRRAGCAAACSRAARILGAAASGAGGARARRSCPVTAAPPRRWRWSTANGTVAHRALELGADAGDARRGARRAHCRRARHRRRRLRAARRHRGRDRGRERSAPPSRVTVRASRFAVLLLVTAGVFSYARCRAGSIPSSPFRASSWSPRCPTPPPSWCCAT